MRAMQLALTRIGPAGSCHCLPETHHQVARIARQARTHARGNLTLGAARLRVCRDHCRVVCRPSRPLYSYGPI